MFVLKNAVSQRPKQSPLSTMRMSNFPEAMGRSRQRLAYPAACLDLLPVA
jgi:hypothetical protein